MKSNSIRSKLMKCINCGKEVKVPKHRWSHFKYCSRRCLWEHHEKNERREVICQVCNKPFTVIDCRATTAKYCSRSCYYKAMHQKGSKELICKECGKPFLAAPSHDRTYCSKDCMYKAKRKETVKHPGFVRKTLIKLGLLGSCPNCGYNEHPEILEVHHINHNPADNKPENLAIVCPNCHKLHHYGNGKTIKLKSVKEQLDGLSQGEI